MFDRVLRRHHHEWIGQLARHAGHGHLALGHRLQQSWMHFGRRAIDFIDQNERVKNRPGGKFEDAAILPPYRRSRNIRRHQIRRALDLREGDIQAAREQLHRAGFGEARRPFDEQMPVREEAGQQPLDERSAVDEAGFKEGSDVAEARADIFLPAPAVGTHWLDRSHKRIFPRLCSWRVSDPFSLQGIAAPALGLLARILLGNLPDLRCGGRISANFAPIALARRRNGLD